MNGSHSLVPVPELWRPLFLCCLGLRQWAALINPLQTKLSGKTRTHWPSAPKEERHEHSCLLKRKTSTSSLNSRKIGEEKTPWRSPTHNETIALVCKKYTFYDLALKGIHGWIHRKSGYFLMNVHSATWFADEFSQNMLNHNIISAVN